MMRLLRTVITRIMPAKAFTANVFIPLPILVTLRKGSVNKRNPDIFNQ
jgi:hypothetical protein